jgi:hypothetical protein
VRLEFPLQFGIGPRAVHNYPPTVLKGVRGGATGATQLGVDGGGRDHGVGDLTFCRLGTKNPVEGIPVPVNIQEM